MNGAEVFPAAAHYYAWEPPDHSIRVLLQLPVIDAFNSWLDEASAAEVGGILLGHVESPDSSSPVVRIENFEPVRIGHQRGPTYTLNEKEKDHFGHHISGAQRRTGLVAVGLVRSHIRRGLYLDIADAALFRRYFPGPAGVFLLLRPGPEPIGGFFWEAGDLQKQAPYARFALDRERLEQSSGVLVMNEGGEHRATPKPRAMAAAKGAPAFGRSPRADVISWRWVLGVAATTVLLAAIWPHVPSLQTPDQPGRIGLGLSIGHQNERLRLTWDVHSPLVEQASGGTLWIDDGQNRRRRDLSRSALLKGAALYMPASGDVNFALEVHNGPLSSTESIRSIGGDVAPTAPPPVAITPAADARPAEVESADRVTARLDTPTETPAAPVKNAEFRAPKRPRRIFQPSIASAPAQIQRRESARQPVEPAVVQSARVVLLPPPALAPVAINARATRLLPPLPELDVVSYDGAPASRFLKIRGAAPGFMAPKASREVRPEIPRFVAESLSGDQRLQLRASVDVAGKVTDVESLTPGANPWLAGAASTALRQWTFEPARSKDRAVASRVTVTFRFRGSAERAVTPDVSVN